MTPEQITELREVAGAIGALQKRLTAVHVVHDYTPLFALRDAAERLDRAQFTLEVLVDPDLLMWLRPVAGREVGA